MFNFAQRRNLYFLLSAIIIIPGVIAMSIKDDPNNRMDMAYDHVVVLWNADPKEVSFTASDLGELKLHPQLTDAHNSQAIYADGRFTLPGRSTAVFVHSDIVPQPTDLPVVEEREEGTSSGSGYAIAGVVALLIAAGAFFGLRKKK